MHVPMRFWSFLVLFRVPACSSKRAHTPLTVDGRVSRRVHTSAPRQRQLLGDARVQRMCICQHMFEYMHMCMYVCLYICIHSYIHVCIYILHMHTSAWGVVPPISRVSVSVCVCVCTRANDVRVNTCIYPCHRPPPGLSLVHIFWEFDRGPLGAILSGSRHRPRTGCCQKGRFRCHAMEQRACRLEPTAPLGCSRGRHCAGG